MSNCHVEELLLVYKALVRDALCTYPQLETAFLRDLERLERFSSRRGVRLFTVDLPAIGKHLDRCLSEGQYTLSGLPLTGRVNTRVVFPKYLGELLRLVFNEDGLLKEDDCDVEAIVFLRQFLYCANKTELPCAPELISKEVEDFIQVDSSLPIPNSVWSKEAVKAEEMSEVYSGYARDMDLRSRLIDAGLSKSESFILAKNLDLVSGLVASTLGPYEPWEWNFRHGPGAIAEETGPVDKYRWSNWSPRLEGRYPIADVGYYSYAQWVDCTILWDKVGSKEPISRLIAVPKTFLKPRLIAAEPSEQQWCQQNLWHYFSERVRGSWINRMIRFRDQKALNQELCREGSRTGDLITVDLSAASDRVTCDVVGQTFRVNPELLCYLQAVRTRFLRQEICKDLPEEIELRKYVTMGSACTFPVESIVFLCITLAACFTARGRIATRKDLALLQRGSHPLFGKVAVFGDDIIAPKDCWELLQKALSALHFKVNESKSFVTGRFRESCGVDAFRGVDVTPVYWKGICNGKPGSIASTLAVSNNFFVKRFFIHTAEQVARALPCSFAQVALESGVTGRKSFIGPNPSSLRTRENRRLFRTEVQVWDLLGSQNKLESSGNSALLQYFTERPSPYENWEHGVALKSSQKLRRRWIALSELQAPLVRGSK